MAGVTWPPGLPPALLVAGYKRTGPKVGLRTQFDAEIQQRRRFTAAESPVDGGVIVTGAELRIFREFYDVTLAGGTLPFDWEDPDTLQEAEIRFNVDEGYSWVCLNPHEDPDQRVYQLSFNYDVMP